MTVIAALHRGGETWIGCDTLALDGTVLFDCGPKWVVGSKWAVGVAGDLRTLNVITAAMTKLLGEKTKTAFELANAIRDALKDDGYESAKERGPKEYGQEFLIASREGVWAVCVGFSVAQLPEGRFWASGSGGELALGCAYGMASDGPAGKRKSGRSAGGHTPEQIMATCIGASIALDTTCGGELWLQKL